MSMRQDSSSYCSSVDTQQSLAAAPNHVVGRLEPRPLPCLVYHVPLTDSPRWHFVQVVGPMNESTSPQCRVTRRYPHAPISPGARVRWQQIDRSGTNFHASGSESSRCQPGGAGGGSQPVRAYVSVPRGLIVGGSLRGFWGVSEGVLEIKQFSQILG